MSSHQYFRFDNFSNSNAILFLIMKKKDTSYAEYLYKTKLRKTSVFQRPIVASYFCIDTCENIGFYPAQKELLLHAF